MADYPAYDENELAESSALIVEGTVISSEYTVLMPRYEGDTEQENPMFGLTSEEKKNALASDDGVPATAVTLRVDTVHKGLVEVGQEIVVLQTGGAVDGVTYLVRGEVPLQTELRYLIFAGESRDGAYAILGGSAGSYLADGDGAFTAVNADTAPFAQIDSDEVESLTE